MNRSLLLATLLLVLASCSQQRFGFRKTIPVDRPSVSIEKKKEEQVRVEKDKAELHASAPAIPADSPAVVKETKRSPALKKGEGQPALSASALKNIIPFTLDQLSPEPKHSAPRGPEPPAEEDLSIITSILSLVFAVLILTVIFTAVALESPYLLILAPILALGAVITGIVALATDSKGKGMAIAGLIIGGIILTVTLLFMAFLWMLEGNSSHP